MSYAGHQINIRGCEIIIGKKKQLHTKNQVLGFFLILWFLVKYWTLIWKSYRRAKYYYFKIIKNSVLISYIGNVKVI